MHIYRGKYPNRVYSVWKMSDSYWAKHEAHRFDRPPWIAQTNDGRMFLITIPTPSNLKSQYDLHSIEIPPAMMVYDYVLNGQVITFKFYKQSTLRKAK